MNEEIPPSDPDPVTSLSLMYTDLFIFSVDFPLLFFGGIYRQIGNTASSWHYNFGISQWKAVIKYVPHSTLLRYRLSPHPM